MHINVPSHVAVHRCSSRQIFGGAKNFCPNLPELARKNLQRKWPLKNNCLHSFSCWVHFLNQSTLQAHFLPKLPQISPNLPQKNKKHGLKKKARTLILGAIFIKSKHIQRSCKPLRKFCPTFHRFCLDFKWFAPDVLGVHLLPLPTAQVSLSVKGASKRMLWFSPTVSGALVNATLLTLLRKSFAEKKRFRHGVLASTARFLRLFSSEILPFLAPDG